MSPRGGACSPSPRAGACSPGRVRGPTSPRDLRQSSPAPPNAATGRSTDRSAPGPRRPQEAAQLTSARPTAPPLPPPAMQAALVALRAEVATLVDQTSASISKPLGGVDVKAAAVALGAARAPHFGHQQSESRLAAPEVALSPRSQVDPLYRRPTGGLSPQPVRRTVTAPSACWPPSRPSSCARAPNTIAPERFAEIAETSALAAAAVVAASRVSMCAERSGRGSTSSMTADISFSGVGEAAFSWEPPDSRRASCAAYESHRVSLDSRRTSLERSQIPECSMVVAPSEPCPPPPPQMVVPCVVALAASAPMAPQGDVPAPASIVAGGVGGGAAAHLDRIKMRCNELMQKANKARPSSPTKKRTSLGGA